MPPDSGCATAIFLAWSCGAGSLFGLGSGTLASCDGVSAAVMSAGRDGWRAISITVATRQTAASPITPAPMAFAKRLDFFEGTGGFFEIINVTPWLNLGTPGLTKQMGCPAGGWSRGAVTNRQDAGWGPQAAWPGGLCPGRDTQFRDRAAKMVVEPARDSPADPVARSPAGPQRTTVRSVGPSRFDNFCA